MATRSPVFNGRSVGASRVPVRALVLLGALVVVATPLAFPGLAAAQARSPADCAALANLRIEDVNLLSATVVPATADLPEHCRVLGYVRPAINFEIRLPVSGWNGKFYMAGCGGFCGRLDSDRPGFVNAMNYGLRRGYAASTTDSGHWGTSVLDGRWAYGNRVAEYDWGQRAVTETARVTKAVIAVYYGTAPRKSYFAGCSTGGRMANMEAMRYPDDFDGIVSGAPALDYTGLVATYFAWLVHANTGPDGKPILTAATVKIVGDAVAAQCGAKDGVTKGLVDDPRTCDFKPSSLACKNGDRTSCLTAGEVKVLETWYSEPRNSAGERLYPASQLPGSEPFWPTWLTGTAQGAPGLIPMFALDFLRYMAFADDPGDAYTVKQFDFDRDPPRLAPMAAIYNSDRPDLSKFKARGGKLVMWHGWADAIVPPQKTILYYEAVEKAMGGRASTQDFLRLFMVPGADHCALQTQPAPGIDQSGIDPLTALEQWVEEGIAPSSLIATKRDKGGKTLWTRPLCPYPQAPRYTGTGDAADAASFVCAEP